MSAACPSCSQVGLVPTAPAYPGCPPPPPAIGCPAVWGAITGTLENQLDLVGKLALYAKLTEANEFTEDQTINGVTVGTGPSSGASNTALGIDALKDSTTASLITALGNRAGTAVTTGTANTLVGASAGASLTTGSNNVAIGATAGPIPGTLNRTISIGSGVNATKDNQIVIGSISNTETVLRGNIVLTSKTITAIGTTGAQTINNTSGSVVFAGAATSLVVTNSFAIAPTSGDVGSIIVASIRTADATAVLGSVVCAANGSFTINMKVAPTGATRVDFILFN